MNPLRLGLLCLAATVALLTSATAGGKKAEQWRNYAFHLPGWRCEFSVPSALASGYNPVPPEIVFGRPGRGFHFGNAADCQRVAMYFGDATRSLNDFDWTVAIHVCETDADKPLASTSELRAFLESTHREKSVLADGREFAPFGEVLTQTIGAHDVVLVKPADLYRIEEVKLKGGFSTMIQPQQRYFIWLDERHFLAIFVNHCTAKRLSPAWHARINALMEEMVARMQFTPDAPAKPTAGPKVKAG